MQLLHAVQLVHVGSGTHLTRPAAERKARGVLTRW
ncbi:MAG: hypothetical protein RL572_1577 [Pseudomonadota bacterium]|jgi:hypothetical protein